MRLRNRSHAVGSRLVLAWVVTGLAGCRLFAPGGEPTPETPTYTQAASREELIYLVQRNAQRLSTLRAEATVVATDQKQVVPASFKDAVLKEAGKEYKKAFNQRTLEGYFALDRSDPRQPERVKFVAEVSGVGRVLELLAIGEAFWVKLPKPDSKMGDYRSVLYFGRYDREAPRPQDNFAMRPQDLMDVFICREMLVSYELRKAKEVFIETWPDHYILHVLRVDPDEKPPVHLYSKIWVERHSLTVAVHQVYGKDGELICEGRFTNHMKVGEEADAVLVPLQARFFWPRDKVLMDVTLRRDALRVNHKLHEDLWKRPKERDAEIVEITPTTSGIRFTPISTEEYQRKGGKSESESP